MWHLSQPNLLFDDYLYKGSKVLYAAVRQRVYCEEVTGFMSCSVLIRSTNFLELILYQISEKYY